MSGEAKLVNSFNTRDEFGKLLKKITNLNEFKEILLKYNLNDFRFEILKEKHKKEVTEILQEQFSLKGGNLIDTPLNFDPNIKRDWDIHINHGIKTGLSICVINNNNNKVCAIFISFDDLNQPNYELMDKLTEKDKIIYEIFDELKKKDKWYEKEVKSNKQYGRIIYGHLGTQRKLIS